MDAVKNTTQKLVSKSKIALSKESLLSLQEIKLEPKKFGSLSDFWEDMRS